MSQANQSFIRGLLPDGDFSLLVIVLRKFLRFIKLTVSTILIYVAFTWFLWTIIQAGLKITAGWLTMSGQNGVLTSQQLCLPVMLAFHGDSYVLDKQPNPHLQILDFVSL